MTVPLARTVAEFVAGVPAAALTADDRRAVDEACLDTVGVLLAGARHPLGRIVLAEAREQGGNPEATVFGLADRTSGTQAAFVHGSLAHALDFDDTAGFGHPSGGLLAALLAAAELTGRAVAGQELVLAYCTGFQVAAALRAASDYDQDDRGLHSTPVFGTIAAAAASARLLGLDPDRTAAALGIAASGVAGLVANFGTMTKPLHMGWAAADGLRASLLARAGLDSTPDVFEAGDGFCATILGRGSYRLAAVTDRLAAVTDKPDSGFRVGGARMTKKYPCCGSSHSAVDALLATMREHGLSYPDIERVEVHGVSPTTPVVRYPRPRDGMQARFSLPYAIAAAMRDGTVHAYRFTDAAVRDPDMAAAMDKVRLAIAPEHAPLARESSTSDRAGANLRSAEAHPVVVHLRDGRVLRRAVTRGELLGGPANPLPEAALLDKFRRNAGRKAGVDPLAAGWLSLDRAPDVAGLIDLTARYAAPEPA